jgi:hypothetical protein
MRRHSRADGEYLARTGEASHQTALSIEEFGADELTDGTHLAVVCQQPQCPLEVGHEPAQRRFRLRRLAAAALTSTGWTNLHELQGRRGKVFLTLADKVLELGRGGRLVVRFPAEALPDQPPQLVW